MRRGKLSNKSIFYVILAGIFTLLSYFLDQQVIQKEDAIRDMALEIENQYQKIDDESGKFEAAMDLQTRVFFSSHQTSSFSTINYKTHLLIDSNNAVIQNFNIDDIKRIVRANLFLQYILTRSSIQELWSAADKMNFTKSDYDNEKIRTVINDLFTFNDNFFEKYKIEYFNQSYINSVADNSILVPDTDGFMRLLYEETNKLNKKLFSYYEILEDLSDIYLKQEELLEANYDSLILEQGKIKIQKNYFILLSILFQILSLLSFLLLFRNFINTTFVK